MKMDARTLFSAVVVCSVVLLAVMVTTTECATVHKRMAVSKKTPMCEMDTQCAWHMYNKISRRVEHIFTDNCECPINTQCIYADDDLSKMAYVYRCKTTSGKDSAKSS